MITTTRRASLYGPHIFHQLPRRIRIPLALHAMAVYEHRVLASVDGQLLPSLSTSTPSTTLWAESDLVPSWVLRFCCWAERYIRTSEDVVVSKVGRELYEFFRNYTRKQWGIDPSELDKSVTRVPTRTNRDGRYFTDTYQAMLYGYTRMFEKMLSHLRSKSTLIIARLRDDPVPEIHRSCGWILRLPLWQATLPLLGFKHETHNMPVHQPVAVVNYRTSIYTPASPSSNT